MINRIGKEATSLFKSNISCSNDFTGSFSSSNCPSIHLDFPLPPTLEEMNYRQLGGRSDLCVLNTIKTYYILQTKVRQFLPKSLAAD